MTKSVPIRPEACFIHHFPAFFSRALGRDVMFDVFLPHDFPAGAEGSATGNKQEYATLYLNDGQDSPRVHVAATLNRMSRDMSREETIAPLIIVAIHANHDRLSEYGIGVAPDFKGRGNKAGQFSRFVIEELMPFVEERYPVSILPAMRATAGYSLGGLMAFDTAWSNPGVFGAAGVFSGAFWWRSRDTGPDYTDADRIMHRLVAAGEANAHQRFWFQAGTEDETDDRNNNGIIDAIDDTLDLMAALRGVGFVEGQMTYHEVAGGKHDQATWATAMPVFLQWAFGLEKA